ncbi:hypothetical protein D3C77_732860 [compost metagenome]
MKVSPELRPSEMLNIETHGIHQIGVDECRAIVGKVLLLFGSEYLVGVRIGICA